MTMRKVLLALSVALVPAFVHADDVYRWKDDGGVVHYSNIARAVPAAAVVVETPITLEVDRLPGAGGEPVLELSGGHVMERHAVAAPVASGRQWLPDAPRIYDEARLRFGLYSAGALYFGGFSHADDITPNLNVYAFTLGPEAWLNAARAELAMRQNGINPRDMMTLYLEQAR
jgi:hypothetical protein